MARKPPVHVVAREGGWAVVRKGNDRATSVHQTQAEAAREGRNIARRHETGFLLLGKDGRIREHNDYGSGQRPQEAMSTGQAMESFAPGTQALGEPTTDEEGQTVQRTTDEQGHVVETTFDEEGNVVDENPVGSVADLPGAEDYEEITDEEGITKRIVKDESGTLIEVQIGPDGSVLDLQIPPGTEKVEETTQQVGQAAQVARDTDGQTADQVQDATGQATGHQTQNDNAGGTTEQAQNASGQVTDQDQSPAGQTARQAVQGVQDTTKQVTEQAQGLVGGPAGGGQQDEEKGREGSQEAADQAADQPGRAARGAQDTAGQAAGQARDAAGGAAQQARDTAGQATRRDDQEASQGGGQQQGGGGQELDATDAARRKAQEVGVDLSQVEGSGAQGKITVNDVKDPSGPAKGGTAGEQRAAGRAEQAAGRAEQAAGRAEQAAGRAEQAAQGARDTAGQTAEEADEATRAAGAVTGPASGGTGRSADRSRKAATDGARGGGTLEGRTDDAEEVRGVTYRERDDDHFEMVGEGYANYDVYDQDGERLGKVDHLFLDEDDRPEYVGVETGLPGGRAVLIPTEVIPAENERRMVVSRPKSVVERGPTFGDEEEVTPELEERVRKHYGLPRLTGTEDRSDPDTLLAEGQTEREREGSGTAGSGIRVGDTESGEFREHDRNVEGVSQPSSDLEDEDELRVRRSEEELRVGTREQEAGSVNVRKRVRTDRERIEVPTRREEVSVERVPIESEASGAEIGDDEVRMPVTEEEVVVEKRSVVKEEIRIRKDVVEDTETVEEDVRREEIEIVDDTERGGRHGR